MITTCRVDGLQFPIFLLDCRDRSPKSPSPPLPLPPLQPRRPSPWSHLKLQSTPDNSNLLGKSKKVRVIGSSIPLLSFYLVNRFTPGHMAEA